MLVPGIRAVREERGMGWKNLGEAGRRHAVVPAEHGRRGTAAAAGA